MILIVLSILIEGSLRQEEISIVLEIDEDIIIDGYPNELVQCFINIYNNAKDAFIENEISDKHLLISLVSKMKSRYKLLLKDNAKGIQDNIIGKIFEPYFTTKHKMQGTGLGLTYDIYI